MGLNFSASLTGLRAEQLVGIALLSGPCVVESEYILRICVLKVWIPCASAESEPFWGAGKSLTNGRMALHQGRRSGFTPHSMSGWKIRYPSCHPGNRLPDQGLAGFPSIWNWEKEIPVLSGLHKLRCVATTAQTRLRQGLSRWGLGINQRTHWKKLPSIQVWNQME